MRLLLAEDERSLSRALTSILQKKFYCVDAVYTGTDALAYLEMGEYDGVILDWMLPGMSGLSVLRTIRQQGNTVPVLLLTAKSEIEDKVAGLDMGASDYLTKPFDSRELLARLRAMLRSRVGKVDNTLRLGNVVLDCSNFVLSTPSGRVQLAGKEFQLMELLMANPHQRISTERLMQRVWGYNTETDLKVVWVYISHLRKKLAQIEANVRLQSVRNTGYCLEEQA